MNFIIHRLIIASIFLLGLLCFTIYSINQEFFLATIILTLSMIFINLYGLITQSLHPKSFVYLLSLSTFFISISVFGSYGIEQKPIGYETFYHFHLEGVAISLLLFLLASSMLIWDYKPTNNIKNIIKPVTKKTLNTAKIKKSKNSIKSDDWEEASVEDLQSGQYQIYKS